MNNSGVKPKQIYKLNIKVPSQNRSIKLVMFTQLLLASCGTDCPDNGYD